MNNNRIFVVFLEKFMKTTVVGVGVTVFLTQRRRRCQGEALMPRQRRCQHQKVTPMLAGPISARKTKKRFYLEKHVFEWKNMFLKEKT